MMSDDDDELPTHLSIAPRIGEEGDSMSTTLSIPVHDEALQHQTETVSNVSVYDDMHPLDPQDVVDTVDAVDVVDVVISEVTESPLPQCPKYDAFHREHYEELVIVTASETSSGSGRVNLPQEREASSSSLTNNNRSNNHDSDVMELSMSHSGGPPVYAQPPGDTDGHGDGNRIGAAH